MTALTDLSDLVLKATGGSSGTPEVINFFKDARVDAAAAATPVAGRWSSLWRYNGHPGGASAAPGAVAIPDNTTEGGLKQADPGGGREKFSVGLAASGLNGGSLVLYDRLLHISGLSGTTTTAQTVQGGTAGSRTPPLTRYTDGLGNEIWIEIYTAIGASSTTATVDYDDQTNTQTTSPAFPIGNTGFNEAQRIIKVPLAAGDYAVRGVVNVDLVATTSTAGNFGVTIAHPLAFINIPGPGIPGKVDWVSGNIGEIQTDACLGLAWFAATAAVPQVYGQLVSLES